MITQIESIVEFKRNYFQKYDERYVLQIGPCDDLHVAHHLQSALNQYHYLILGMIGGSNAKSENEVAFATTLYDCAITKNVIQTKFNGETVVPSYNKKIIVTLVQNLVMKFLNLVLNLHLEEHHLYHLLHILLDQMVDHITQSNPI